MRKTRNLFKKIGGIKETFHARMDKIKDRNSKDLTEREATKKGRQNAQKTCTKKIIMTWVTTMVWPFT